MVETFDLRRRHERAVTAPDGRTALRRMVEFLGILNERLDAIGWVLEEAQHLDEAFGRDWRRRVVGIRGTIERDVVTRLHREGSLRDGWTVPTATDLFLALTALGTWREFIRELAWTPTRYVSRVTRLIETSLLQT